MDEVAAFLRAHPPFDALPEPELDGLAAAARTAAFGDGETIFAQGSGPQTSAWIVRDGAVELVDHGRVLDLLGPGELFGYASMLAELPTGFPARARGPTVCYCLPRRRPRARPSASACPATSPARCSRGPRACRTSRGRSSDARSPACRVPPRRPSARSAACCADRRCAARRTRPSAPRPSG